MARSAPKHMKAPEPEGPPVAGDLDDLDAPVPVAAVPREPAEERELTPRQRRLRAAAELPILLAVAIVVTLIVKALLAQAFYIPSGSMEPQLHINDRVLVSRTSYRLHEPNRGDIVVFPSPLVEREEHGLVDGLVDDVLDALAIGDRGEEELIKRVVGLPGELISAHGGSVYIDGRRLLEPYLPDGVTTSDFPPTRVPEGRLFVMGDNRGNSHDSRFSDVGTIAVDDLVGRAIARVWPPNRTAFL